MEETKAPLLESTSTLTSPHGDSPKASINTAVSPLNIPWFRIECDHGHGAQSRTDLIPKATAMSPSPVKTTPRSVPCSFSTHPPPTELFLAPSPSSSFTCSSRFRLQFLPLASVGRLVVIWLASSCSFADRDHHDRRRSSEAPLPLPTHRRNGSSFLSQGLS